MTRHVVTEGYGCALGRRHVEMGIKSGDRMEVAEVDLARKVKVEVQGRFSRRGVRLTVVNKNIGYELRCADPIPFDAAYCRDLGYSAIRFLMNGGSEAIVSVQEGRLVPIPFADIREEGTGKTRIRMVNVESEGYRVAREYMIRLEPDDFNDPAWVAKMAVAGNMTIEEFRDRFGYMGGRVAQHKDTTA